MFFLQCIRKGKIEKKKRKGVRKKLKEIRLLRNMTQQNVADLTGIARAYYSSIENYTKEPSFRVVKLIKNVLDYEGDDLFDIFKEDE